MARTLAALEEHLGYPTSVFILAPTDPFDPVIRAYAGAQRGRPDGLSTEYFELGRRVDQGWLVSAVTAAEGRVLLCLAAGWSQGYLALHDRDGFGSRDRLLLQALAPGLNDLLAQQLPDGFRAGLSVRECQVVELLTLGFSNAQIGKILEVREDTVKKHVSHAMAKAHIASRTQLAVAWATGGRLDLPARTEAKSGGRGPSWIGPIRSLEICGCG